MTHPLHPFSALSLALAAFALPTAAADEPLAAHRCSVPDVTSVEFFPLPTNQPAAATAAASTVQVHLVGNAAFVNAWGSGAQARAQALFDVAAAEWASAAGLDLELCLADITLISGGVDPWLTTADSFDLLFDFRTWGQTNLPVDTASRDLVVLLAGEDLIQGSGLSFQSVICTSSAYGVTQGALSSEQYEGAGLAHQIGHILGAEHDGSSNPCNPFGNIMAAAGNPATPSTGISSCTVTSVQNHLANLANFGLGGCLANPCQPVCPADVNGDGILDNGDIGAFVTLFLAADLAADFNSDGILDNGDIGAFVQAFLAGCD